MTIYLNKKAAGKKLQGAEDDLSKLHAPQVAAIMDNEVKNNMKSAQKEEWNAFIIKNGGSFLQSYEWGEFQKSAGRQVFRFSPLGHSERSEESSGWAAQFIENKLPCVDKFYWHAPRGPVFILRQVSTPSSTRGAQAISPDEYSLSEATRLRGGVEGLISEVKKLAGKNVIFFRLGPEWEMANSKELIANGFQQLPYDIEPSQTQILDISKTEDELLAQMHEKWRYNIRLAQKKGVQVKFVQSESTNFEQYFEEFYRLVSQGTSERKNIKHHSKEYYKKQLEISKQITDNSQQPKFILFVAEYESKVIAANIVVIFGTRVTYLHGATSSEHREVMAPHLLQWEQIKYAKQQGCGEYDFWGIFNEHTLDKRGKSWEGFTRFKKGFGGKEVNYVGYWDYPLDKKWYSLYRLVQKFRR